MVRLIVLIFVFLALISSVCALDPDINDAIDIIDEQDFIDVITASKAKGRIIILTTETVDLESEDSKLDGVDKPTVYIIFEKSTGKFFISHENTKITQKQLAFLNGFEVGDDYNVRLLEVVKKVVGMFPVTLIENMFGKKRVVMLDGIKIIFIEDKNPINKQEVMDRLTGFIGTLPKQVKENILLINVYDSLLWNHPHTEYAYFSPIFFSINIQSSFVTLPIFRHELAHLHYESFLGSKGRKTMEKIIELGLKLGKTTDHSKMASIKNSMGVLDNERKRQFETVPFGNNWSIIAKINYGDDLVKRFANGKWAWKGYDPYELRSLFGEMNRNKVDILTLNDRIERKEISEEKYTQLMIKLEADKNNIEKRMANLRSLDPKTPKYGCVRAYGATKLTEDVATFVEKIVEDPDFFKNNDLIGAGADIRYKQKIDLLLKYHFIRQEEYDAVFECEPDRRPEETFRAWVMRVADCVIADYIYEQRSVLENDLEIFYNPDSRNLTILNFYDSSRRSVAAACIDLASQAYYDLKDVLPGAQIMRVVGHESVFFTEGIHSFILISQSDLIEGTFTNSPEGISIIENANPILVDPSLKIIKDYSGSGYSIEKVYDLGHPVQQEQYLELEPEMGVVILKVDNKVYYLMNTGDEDNILGLGLAILTEGGKLIKGGFPINSLGTVSGDISAYVEKLRGIPIKVTTEPIPKTYVTIE